MHSDPIVVPSNGDAEPPVELGPHAERKKEEKKEEEEERGEWGEEWGDEGEEVLPAGQGA